jgi:hypothetical protein
MRKFLLYATRWQLSTPILWLCVVKLSPYMSSLYTTIIANFIGACIFIYVDKLIFRSKYLNPLWEIKGNVKCHDCGKVGHGFRVALKHGYDRTKDKKPEFRCNKCAEKKAQSMGIEI